VLFLVQVVLCLLTAVALLLLTAGLLWPRRG